MTIRRGTPYQPISNPMDPTSLSNPMEGFQNQVNQLTEAINAVIGQLNAMTNRLDQLEQNNQAPRGDGPRAYPPQAEPNREEPGLE